MPNHIHRETDYVKVAQILLSSWYLLFTAICISLLLAHLYLWLCPKTYSSSGILKFEEKKPELSDLVKVFSQAGRTPAALQSEKLIIHSRSILLDAIRQLDYKVSFYTPGKFRDQECYPQKPLQIRLLKDHRPSHIETGFSFKPVDRKTFSLGWQNEGRQLQQRFAYNKPVNIRNTSFVLQYPGLMPAQQGYLFKFNTDESLLERASEGLQTSEVAKNTNVISLWQTDANPHFAADLLNAIMKAYLHYDQRQKAQSATQMIRFINGQMGSLDSAVKNAAHALEKQKQRSGITDLRLSVNYTLSQLADLESKHALLKLQEIAILELNQQLSTDQSEFSLNLNLEGQVDPLLLPLLNSLNNLLSEKNALLKTYHNTAAPVVDINAQIKQVKSAALQNVRAASQRIRKNKNYLDLRLAQVNQQLAGMPAAEKNLGSLGRNFEIKEKVYSFLSEKRLETQINRAAILPGATIIEAAQINDVPRSPDKARIYRTAVAAGLLAGIILLICIRVLNPYIYHKETVEQATGIPIAGLISKYPGNTTGPANILDMVKSRTIFAESVRALRTQLNFLHTGKKSMVISLTSEVAGEGKSFIALQLAASFAAINKKVVLVSADLRQPKLHQALGLSNHTGLSNYLCHQKTPAEIIQHTSHNNIDVICSGPIPPNPAELLQGENLKTLVDALRTQYDIILVDTAPIGLVSDSIPLLCQASINIFIIRYGISKRTALPIPEGLTREYNLKNMVIVLNAFEENKLHAGYHKNDINPGTPQYYADFSNHKSSGYYQEAPKLKWWKFRN